jgi:hypothetical protein
MNDFLAWRGGFLLLKRRKRRYSSRTFLKGTGGFPGINTLKIRERKAAKRTHLSIYLSLLKNNLCEPKNFYNGRSLPALQSYSGVFF